MSGDSTFGNSNVAAESSISVSDVNETLDKPETSNDGSLQFNNTELPDQSVDAEWERRSAAAMANLLKKLGDSTTQPKSPEKRLSRWRQKLSSRGMDEAQSSKKTEEQFNLTDDSIDVADQKLKSRRTFFQRNAPKKKSTEISENAFDVTESSVEERPTRVTRGFAKKYTAKTNVDPKDFDTTDGSIVVDKLKESRKKRFKHQKRKVTQADINEFNVSDEDEKPDESQREKTGDDLVLELDEAEKESEREGAGNSMDESEESEHEAENNENQSLEIQSPVEQAEAEDSLDEEVDENETESSKSNRNVSKNGDEVDKQKNNGVAEAGSSNEPSSLLLEFQLSTDNHSECKIVVTESHISHNRSHISHKEGSTNNISMTDITMTSRRSRRFTQHGSQFLDVVENREKSRDIDLQNFGKSLCDVGDILNVSPNLGKKSLGPVEGEINLILSPAKEISESDSSNRSLQRRKRSSASKELFSNSRTSSSGKATSENDSKQNLDDSIGVHGGSVQPLNLEDRDIDRSLKDSSNGGITEVNISKNKNMGRNGSKENMNLSREDVLNDSVASNRSLRSRTRGESNKSIIDDVDSTKSGKSGNAINESLKETDEVRDMNRSLRKRTGNKNSSMSEKEGSEENSKGANDSQNEEKGNRSSRNGSERGGKNKSVTEEEIVDMSMDIINASQQGEDELENSKRSLKNKRGRRDKSSSEEDSSKENEKRGNVSIDALNVSKQGLDESDSSHRSLRDTSASKRLFNQSATENQASKKGRRESSKKVVTEKEILKENYDNVIIDAQDEERAGNRSLRSRSVTKGKLNKSISEDQISKQNVDDTMNSVHDSLGFVSNARTTRRASMAASKEHTSESSSDENAENIHVSLRSSVGRDKRSRSKNSSGLVDQVSSDFGIAGIGEDSPMTDINAMNGVTYSSEEIVGQKQGARSKNSSVLYNSLDSFGEEQSNSVSMLQIPRSVNESAAAINNSLDSTVNASRRDQPIPPNQSADEMMPAPRSLPFRKRRLANSNTPSFSSLAQKKKRNAPAETDSIVGLVDKQNDLVAINNNREVAVTKVDYKCPKLKTPEPWVTDRLYDSIIEKLEPRYKLRSRLRAEEFVVFLCSTVKTVIKKKENYEKDVEDLKYEMARLNLIENLFQFFRFVDKFLPWQFQHKSLPLVQSFITGKVVTFEKGTLYDPIL